MWRGDYCRCISKRDRGDYNHGPAIKGWMEKALWVHWVMHIVHYMGFDDYKLRPRSTPSSDADCGYVAILRQLHGQNWSEVELRIHHMPYSPWILLGSHDNEPRELQTPEFSHSHENQQLPLQVSKVVVVCNL